jgi:hypothetical protein
LVLLVLLVRGGGGDILLLPVDGVRLRFLRFCSVSHAFFSCSWSPMIRVLSSAFFIHKALLHLGHWLPGMLKNAFLQLLHVFIVNAFKYPVIIG